MLEAICQKLEIDISTDAKIDAKILENAYREEQVGIHNRLAVYGKVISDLLARGSKLVVNVPIKLPGRNIVHQLGMFVDDAHLINPGSYTVGISDVDSRLLLKYSDGKYEISPSLGIAIEFAVLCCKGDIRVEGFAGDLTDSILPQVERLGNYIRATSRCEDLPLGEEWIDRILVRVKNVDVINDFVEKQSFDELDKFWITVYHGDNDMMLIFMENYNNHGENFAAVPIEKGIKLLSDWLYLKAIDIVGFTPQEELK